MPRDGRDRQICAAKSIAAATTQESRRTSRGDWRFSAAVNWCGRDTARAASVSDGSVNVTVIVTVVVPRAIGRFAAAWTRSTAT